MNDSIKNALACAAILAGGGTIGFFVGKTVQKKQDADTINEYRKAAHETVFATMKILDPELTIVDEATKQTWRELGIME